MTKAHSAGGNIDSWCTKCKLMLAHTIIAMVDNSPKKVKCNTCNSKHNFREKPVGAKKVKPSGRNVKSKEAHYSEYKIRMEGCDISKTKKYSIRGDFMENDIIDHSTFGIGIIKKVVQNDRIEVLFMENNKLLIQNQP